MRIGNFGFELAEHRAAQERDAGVARVQAAVKAEGSVICIDCPDEIEPARRLAAPFAKRCFRCQTLYEKDMRRSA